MNVGDAASTRLADLGDEQGGRGRSARAGRAGAGGSDAGRYADQAPAVGSLEAILGIGVVLKPDVQVVRDRAAEGVVVADLEALPEEAVVITRELAEADRAAAGALAGDAVETLRGQIGRASCRVG